MARGIQNGARTSQYRLSPYSSTDYVLPIVTKKNGEDKAT